MDTIECTGFQGSVVHFQLYAELKVEPENALLVC